MTSTSGGAPPTALSEVTQGDQIGRGATATVHLATATATGQRFVLKVVEKKKIAGQTQLARLFREKELLNTLSHPAIVKFHATFKDDERLYFLLELLAGGELLWHIRQDKRCRLMPPDARIVLAQLLLPLQFMQEQRVLYRDLKPPNIVFTASGRLKLVDFGHAKRIEGSTPLEEERSMSVCGTPHYNAPETVRGEGHGLAAQLWALGVLHVEMLYGRAPFWAAGPAPPLNEQILAADPDLVPLPEDAQVLARALLTADPTERAANFDNKGYAGVRAHAYFADVDWAAIESGGLVPNFDFALHAADLLGETTASKPNTDEVEELSKVFADF